MSSKNKTTASKEAAKPALAPKLRFLEFQSAGDWTTVKLGAVATILTEKVGKNICMPMSITSGVGLVSQEDKFGRVIAGDSYKNYLLLKPYDFAYNKSATKEYPEGFLTLYSGTELAAVPNSIFTCFRINGESPDVRFLNYQFSDNLHGRWLRKFIQVGARAHGSLSINDEDLMALPVPVPDGKTSVAEQKKIAECLSSVDELMAAQARKVDTLKTHKKGLIQQLFPREGETQPRLRFPEFRNAGDWLSKRLEDISHSVFDGTHQTPTYTPQGVPFYSVENLISGNANKFISRDDYLLATKKNRPEKDDILITRIGKIGYSQVVTWDHEFSVYVTLAVIKKSKAFNSNFLSYFMQSDFYQSELRAKSLPNAVPPKINLDSLRSTTVLLTNEDEQQRIASCLSSLDALITAEIQKLDALKSHKKGLMQQLFPSVEETA